MIYCGMPQEHNFPLSAKNHLKGLTESRLVLDCNPLTLNTSMNVCVQSSYEKIVVGLVESSF